MGTSLLFYRVCWLDRDLLPAVVSAGDKRKRFDLTHGGLTKETSSFDLTMGPMGAFREPSKGEHLDERTGALVVSD